MRTRKIPSRQRTSGRSIRWARRHPESASGKAIRLFDMLTEEQKSDLLEALEG